MAAALLASCSNDGGPPLAVSGVKVLAPLPGSDAGVAYMTIENRTDAPVTITGVSSPQFDRVEIHETSLVDGVSQMRQLHRIDIGGNASVTFQPGGRHIMLIGPKDAVAVGSAVTLELSHSQGQLIVSATLADRSPGN